MSAALRCNDSRPWRAGFARRFAVPSILCLALFAAAPDAASAESGIRIGIGPGIGGFILTDPMRQTKSTRKPSAANTTVVKRKPVTRSSSSQSRTKSQSATARTPDRLNTAAPAPTTRAAPAATVGAVAAPATALGAAASKPTGPSAETISTREEIKSAQEHLRYLGYDIPDATGALDLKTKIAIMQFQESAGISTTGILTVEQLQLLFRTAAERQARTN